MITPKKIPSTITEKPTLRGGLIFNPSGMTQEEYAKRLKDSGSTYIPMSRMQEIFEAKSKRKDRKNKNQFKDGGLVSGKAQAKKYFKGIF